MEEEKPNESFHWKNKLDDLDHLPGEARIDKDLAWDKLHDRLREKGGNKRAIWYWPAAACLLIVLSLMMLTRKERDNIPKQTRHQPTAVSSLKPLQIRDTARRIFSMEATEIKHTIRAEKSKRHTSPAFKIEVIPDRPVIQAPVITMQPPPEQNRLDKPDTLAMVALTPVKHKMRVIHINELGAPVEEQNRFAGNSASPDDPARSPDRNVVSVLSITKNNSDNIVKIKLAF